MEAEETCQFDESVVEEIEALKAIFSSELDISYTESGRPTLVTTTLYPATAEEVNQQYVQLTVRIQLPNHYPNVIPDIEFYKPRGLSEEFLREALNNCRQRCEEYKGSPMIYEITELLRESLTNSNRPTGHCTICLYKFVPEDVFTYTPCYHHYHSHCLLRYVLSVQKQWEEEALQESGTAQAQFIKKEKQLQCPVCREPITVEINLLRKAPPPYGARHDEQYQQGADFQRWRKQMDEMYQKQKTQGGIINSAEEESRFLIVTDPCPDAQTPEVTSTEATMAVQDPEPIPGIKQLQMGPSSQAATSDAPRSSRGVHHRYGSSNTRVHFNYSKSRDHFHPKETRQDKPATYGRPQQRYRNKEPRSNSHSLAVSPPDAVSEVAEKLANIKPT